MSGAPVWRRDGAVVEVVSARYNSSDDWLRGTVWVARVEELVPLLHGLASVSIAKRRADGGAELTLTIDENRVRLSGSGVDVVATELHRRWVDRGDHDQVADAHLRAADYWQWRVRVWPQDRGQDLEDLLEARYHLLAAGDPGTAAALTENVCAQLHGWGAWDREEALIHDTLAHLPDSSDRLPAWLTQLGDISVGRGRVGDAARRYAQGLAIAERLVELDPDNPISSGT